MELIGVVILYNPENTVLNNIRTYIDELEVLYILDNSDNPNEDLINSLKNIKKVKYVAFHQNRGIAFALNFVLNQGNGYKYILTMDQDSFFDTDMMSVYKTNVVRFLSHDDSIAIFSLNWRKSKYDQPYEYVNNAITSGSILDINKALSLGGFDENLFIDQVDFEYCYRAQRHGYSILQFNDVELNHHLGTMKQYTFLGFHFSLCFHSALRKYYICRNNLYVMKRYPQVRFNYSKDMIKLFVVTIVFEKNKFRQLKYLGMGVRDFYHNKWGKLDD